MPQVCRCKAVCAARERDRRQPCALDKSGFAGDVPRAAKKSVCRPTRNARLNDCSAEPTRCIGLRLVALISAAVLAFTDVLASRR